MIDKNFAAEWDQEDIEDKKPTFEIPDGTYNALIKSGKYWPAEAGKTEAISVTLEFPKFGNHREFWNMRIGSTNEMARKIAKRNLKKIFPKARPADLPTLVEDFETREATVSVKRNGQYLNFDIKKMVSIPDDKDDGLPF